MERIEVKFFRIHKYTDPTGMFKVIMELLLFGNMITGKMTAICEGFPTIVTILGPFDPMGIMEIEKTLRTEESEGRIKDLVMEDEIVGYGVKIKMNPNQVQMN